jgi:excisionase family DNA binding protein
LSKARDNVPGGVRSVEAGDRGPFLDQVASVENLPIEDLPELLGRLERDRAAAWVKILSAPRPAGNTGSEKVVPALMTAAEVAAVLRFSRGHVYELIRSGELPALRRGRSVRIRPEVLEAWQSRHQTRGIDSARPRPASSNAARAKSVFEPTSDTGIQPNPRTGQQAARRERS